MADKDVSDELVSVYFKCDKVKCGRKNNRKIVRFDRSEAPGPYLYFNDECDYCGREIHEPLYIDITVKEEDDD